MKREFHLLDPCSQRYQKWKEYMIKLELFILRDLGYRINIVLPHDYVLQCINYLDASALANDAWGYANDAIRLPGLALLNPKIMACGCIAQAKNKNLKVNLPESWWRIFNVTKEQIEYFNILIHELYSLSNKRFIYIKEMHPDKRHYFMESIKYPNISLIRNNNKLSKKNIKKNTTEISIPLIKNFKTENKNRELKDYQRYKINRSTRNYSKLKHDSSSRESSSIIRKRKSRKNLRRSRRNRRRKK